MALGFSLGLAYREVLPRIVCDMIRLEEIPLTDFQRNVRVYIRHVMETQEPIALTVGGEAEVVVQDVQSYEAMLDQIERMKFIAAIREAEEDIAAGRVFTSEEVFSAIRREFGLPD